MEYNEMEDLPEDIKDQVEELLHDLWTIPKSLNIEGDFSFNLDCPPEIIEDDYILEDFKYGGKITYYVKEKLNKEFEFYYGDFYQHDLTYLRDVEKEIDYFILNFYYATDSGNEDKSLTEERYRVVSEFLIKELIDRNVTHLKPHVIFGNASPYYDKIAVSIAFSKPINSAIF